MNPSTALARVFVDELTRHRVREVVLAPGSRSAPLAYALHDADRAGRLRLHVRIDERTAGFLALGLAKAAQWPVAVVTTSGTAVANLHPAVLEAHHAGVPLLVLSADRPPELRGSGANQTTDQIKVFGDVVRLFHEVGAPERRAGEVAYWRGLLSRAVVAARGELSGDPGPVHLNLAFRDPLVPDADDSWVEPLDGRPDLAAWTDAQGVPPWLAASSAPDRLGSEPRTVVVVGDASPLVGLAAADLAERRGWPLLAEPSSGAWGRSSIAAAPLIAGATDWLARHLPRRAVVVGRPTLSRSVARLLRHPDIEVDVVAESPRWSDPGLVARRVFDAAQLWVAADQEPVGVTEFQKEWLEAGRTAQAAVDDVLADQSEPTGYGIARELFAAAPEGSLVVLGSSNAVRDVDLAAAPVNGPVSVLANRGLAGIDGTISTAVGAALEHHTTHARPSFALVGDLTFLHDSNGLVMGHDEPRPDLTIVVVNDDGGGIFTVLEQGAPELAAPFERIFGTPHGVDLGALCAATRTPHRRSADLVELRQALAERGGMRVIEVPVNRSGHRDLHARVRAAVTEALSRE